MRPTGTAIGLGIYSREEAARLIGVTPSRLRRWAGGYTYQYRYRRIDEPRSRPPVVAVDLPPLENVVALSFVELMELRVVRRLRDKGVSLQEVRKAAEVMAAHFETSHPFASRRVYTDGRKVFAALQLSSDLPPDLVLLSRAKVAQVIAGGILEPFVDAIDFEKASELAERWWPSGRGVPVLLDPKIVFGAPALQGTRLRTDFVAELAEAVSREEIARTYDIDVRHVDAAIEFEQRLKAA